MANQNGIFITLKAWLPVEGSISEQIAKLQMVEKAHETSDYAELLKAAKVEDIKTEQKTRRVEDQPTTSPAAIADEILGTNITGSNDESGLKEEFDQVEPKGEVEDPDYLEPAATEEAVPQFLRGKRRAAATDEAA